jgi:hypothetical protein
MSREILPHLRGVQVGKEGVCLRISCAGLGVFRDSIHCRDIGLGIEASLVVLRPLTFFPNVKDSQHRNKTCQNVLQPSRSFRPGQRLQVHPDRRTCRC